MLKADRCLIWNLGNRSRLAPATLCRFCLVFGVLLLMPVLPARSQTPPASKNEKTETKPAPPPPAPQAELSDAEKVIRLRRTIEEDSSRLKSMQDDLTDPESEYAKAEKEFLALDIKYSDLMKEQQKLRDAGKTEEADALNEEVKALEKNWKLAKDRFQLAIEGRRTQQQKMASLEEKIAQDKIAVDKLLGLIPKTKPETPPSAPPTASPPTGTPTEASTPPTTPSTPAPPGTPGTTPPTPATGTETPAQPATPTVPEVVSPELEKARQKAQAKSEVATVAAEEVAALDSRIKVLQQDIATERQLRVNARKKADNAQETEKALAVQVQRAMVEGAPKSQMDDIWNKIAEARDRFKEATAESRQLTDSIDDLQTQLASLNTEKMLAMRQAEQSKREAEAAQEKVAELENPFTIQNITEWILRHGPNLVFIIMGMYLANLAAGLFGSRLVDILLRGTGSHHGKLGDRTDRANTLAGVAQNAAKIAINTGGGLMIFEEIGIDVTVLLGGVAVLGLAAAFGAQNLIRDYFTGFMILLENQYTLNDVVKIGDVSGQVEQVTLRMTVLRDLEGSVHFIPNGEITAVKNMTHGWSRALFEIGIAYKENVDDVMKLLMEIGQDLRKDSYFGSMILENPTMLGLDKMDDSAIIIKFFIKTRPLKQWEVKREMLRQIKNRFDELGIEIPFPQRTVHHRYENGAPHDRMEPSFLHQD